MLNKVLGIELAKEAFITKSATLIEALELTNESDDLFGDYIHKSISLLQEADGLVLKVKSYAPSIEDDLKLIQQLARKISRTIQDKEDEKS